MKTKINKGIRFIVVVYFGILLIAFFSQRVFLYPGRIFPPRVPQITAGKNYEIPISDSTKVYAFFVAPVGKKPTIVHFHGNGEQLADEVGLANSLHAQGLGVYAMEYPGYGLAKKNYTSEQTINADAEIALSFLIKELHIPSKNIVLQGQSLGSGVAAEMALRGYGSKLILISPYTSIADMGSVQPPFSLISGILPIRFLVLDKFATADKAPRIEQPTLIIHGSDDRNIPSSMGKKLAPLFPRATLKIIAGGHHNDLLTAHAQELIQDISDFAKSRD